MRGTGSPYLWAWKRAEEKARETLEQITIEHLKDLARYEKGVCLYCPQVYCEVDKLTECYSNFEKKEVK